MEYPSSGTSRIEKEKRASVFAHTDRTQSDPMEVAAHTPETYQLIVGEIGQDVLPDVRQSHRACWSVHSL